MYTGTLIADLFTAVERVEGTARPPQPDRADLHPPPAERQAD